MITIHNNDQITYVIYEKSDKLHMLFSILVNNQTLIVSGKQIIHIIYINNRLLVV